MSRIKILNYRQGFATNSSSSHSIVINTGGTKYRDRLPEYAYEYGWENFILASADEKRNYFIAQLCCNLATESPKEAASLIGDIFGYRPERVSIDDNRCVNIDGMEVSVDHQSVLTIPCYKSGERALDLFKHLVADVISDPDYIVIGGNDNSSEGGALALPTANTLLNDFVGGCYTVVRTGNTWVVMSAYGTKTTIEFPADKKPEIAYPTLLDINITDKCNHGCPKCYRSCTEDGKHADLAQIEKIAKTLQVLPILDIALGGGNVCLHPEFRSVCKAFNKRNIAVAPTIHFDDFMELQTNEEHVIKKSLQYIKAVGVSFKTFEQFKAILASDTFPYVTSSDGYESVPLTLHYIIGAYPDEIVVLKECLEHYYASEEYGHLNLLLLGFKPMGRAEGAVKFTYQTNFFAEILELLDKHKNPNGFKQVRIAIDTALAQKYQHYLDESGIKKETYFLTEGYHSRYIDAVANTVAESSYSGVSEPITDLRKQLQSDYTIQG